MEEKVEDSLQPELLFKKKPRKQLRRRRTAEDNDDDAEEAEVVNNSCNLQDLKERQRLRCRPSGVNMAALATGKRVSIDHEINTKDPFMVKAGGGLVNMTALKSAKLKDPDDAYDVGIGTQFSAETNKRDEDEEMMKYIEGELQKHKGHSNSAEDLRETDPKKYLTPEEAALYALPDYLRQSTSNRSEEMLSNQMLNGIPEVDLGIDAKIRNIEATEEAKQRLMQKEKRQVDAPSQFVPTNMAVNFLQQNRFNIEENAERRRRPPIITNDQDHHPHWTEGGSNNLKRATDDYHYDKFKKLFRR